MDDLLLKNGKPYIVAELNSSHRGKIEIAKEMIDAAKECGCDAVKFQSWTAESLYSKSYYDSNPISKRMVKGFSLSGQQLEELANYCQQKKIDFSSTPYSKSEVDFLVQNCNPTFVKIASMDINNIPFLKYIARKNLPIVLSTGMATIEEIEKAVATIEEEGNNKINLLHCVSVYPVNLENVNLNNITMLKNHFPNITVGFSDHTIGFTASCAAVAMGAKIIEKHFTLDNKMIGWDNQMATEPGDMKMLVDACHKTFLAMGSYERKLQPEELEQRQKMRRSLVAGKDLEAGCILTLEDIDAKRPGDGISVSEYESVVGKRVVRHILKDEIISMDYLE